MTRAEFLLVDHDERTRQKFDEVMACMRHKYHVAGSLEEAREMLAVNDYISVVLGCEIAARPGGEPCRQNSEHFMEDGVKASVVLVYHRMADMDEDDMIVWCASMAHRGVKKFVRRPFRSGGRTLDRAIEKLTPGYQDRRPVPNRGACSSCTAAKPEAAPTLEPEKPAPPPMIWSSIPNEPVTLDAFMAKYCEQRSKETRKCRKEALQAAARHETVTLPPVAETHKNGAAKRYFVHDLLAAWQGFIDAGVDLPPLAPKPKVDPMN